MIPRPWRGWTAPERADRYEEPDPPDHLSGPD